MKVNGINTPIKRRWMTEWIKNYSSICYLQNTHFRTKDTSTLKVKGWRESIMQMGVKKSWGSNTLNQTRTRDKEGHYSHKGDNSRRRYYNCKYTCTQYERNQIHKTVDTNLKALISKCNKSRELQPHHFNQ